MSGKRLNLRLSDENFERLQKHAKVYGETTTGLAVWAVLDWMTQREREAEMKEKLTSRIMSASDPEKLVLEIASKVGMK
jgi:hypothetical protein